MSPTPAPPLLLRSTASPAAATMFDVPSPAACPSAPPSTPRIAPVPDDVQDIFRDLPSIDELDELVLRGPTLFDGADGPTRDVGGSIAMGATRSSQQYVNALAEQMTPSAPPAAVRWTVQTGGVVADPDPRFALHHEAGGGVVSGGTPAHPPSSSINYPQPVYGVLHPEGVGRILAYHTIGTYANSCEEPLVEPDVPLTREGFRTVLPLPPRNNATTPSTPGNAFAGMSIDGRPVRSGTEDTSALSLLAQTAAYLAHTQARCDEDAEMRLDGDVTPIRAGSPRNLNQVDDVREQQDCPVPGFTIDPEEFARQQQELIRLQLAHDEARASPAIIRLPTAQFYTRVNPRSPVMDPVLLRGYAPMEVDGAPAPRFPLSHARTDGPQSSDNDLYAPPPLDDNRPDDPVDAPRLPHLFDGAEVPGPVLHNGEARYSHDIPIRNSAAVSAAVQGASGSIPQIWQMGDYLEDARHLAGGNAAPPQHVMLPPPAIVTFTTIPLEGAPPIHFDDPEFLVKGLAAERVHVVYRQPQATAILARIFNGGAPRASNVKSQSDALAESISSAVPDAKDFIIVPPAQACGQELSLQDQPTTWIVLRLTPPQVAVLVRQRVWSSRKITFLAFNRDLKFDRFIGRVGYYTHNTDNDIDTSIRATFAGPLILPSIRSLVAGHPHIIPADIDLTVLRILNSIRVNVVTYPNGNIIANVYCDSPTPLVESWRVWTSYVHTVPFWSDLNPTGQFLRPVRCGGCSGADHPTFLCPLTLLPGWNGPTPGAATIEGPATAVLPGAPAMGRGTLPRGTHPYRGGLSRGRRGRGRAAPL